VLVGDSGVGKTSFMKRLVHGTFEETHDSTIGAEFFKISYFTKKGNITFNVWDMGGEVLQDVFLRNADCAIILLDNISKRRKKWLTLIRNHCGNIPVAVFVNKCDIKAVKHGISVKDNINLNKPFSCLAKELLFDDTIRLYPPLPKITFVINYEMIFE